MFGWRISLSGSLYSRYFFGQFCTTCQAFVVAGTVEHISVYGQYYGVFLGDDITWNRVPTNAAATVNFMRLVPITHVTFWIGKA